MYDVTVLLTSFTHLQNIATALVGIRDFAKLNEKVIEMQGAIITAQNETISFQERYSALDARIRELVDQNRELQEQLRSVNEKLRTKDSLKFDTNAYWKENVDGTPDGPFCSKCWDKDEKLVRMTSCNDLRYHECPDCQRSLTVLSPTFFARRP